MKMCFKNDVSLWAVLVSTVIIPVLAAQGAIEKPRSAQLAVPRHFIVTPSQVKWTNPPAGMARGTPSVDGGSPLRYALVQGDPMKAGVPFTIRLGCSDGYKAAPHWHPTDENLVVLRGTFGVGPGDKFEAAGMQDIPAGAYGFMPRRMHHFGLCKGETDILVYGVGPFQINWVEAPGAGKAKPATK
jgi:hypothetical protein